MKRTVQLFLIIFSLLIISSNVLANDINNIDIRYRAHVARIGWMDPMVKLGNPIGTTGDFRQLEGIEFQTENLPIGLTLKARGYVSNRGWQDYIVNNGVIGTTGKGLALEAIELNFEPISGFESDYDIYYRVHVTRLGWLGWTKNGETAGTTGFALPIEAVETMVVPAGTVKLENDTDSYISQDQIDDLNLKFSLDTSNGKTKTSDNTITTSDNETFYGLSAQLNDPESSIAYQAHCSYIGWCGWKHDGKVSGDDNNPIEAVQFKLLGKLAEKYDIYYQVSIPYYGWLDWASNGEYAGTMKGNLPINGLRLRILPKGIPIQENTYRAFFEVPTEDYFKGRGIMVSIPLQLVFLRDENNKMIFISDCATGKPGTERATPTGSFRIIKKTRNEDLIGPDYRYHVDYWIPFDGSEYGFHDANWRKDSEFGRDVYNYYESHGCVNMRLKEIAQFNELVRPDDLVIIH